MLDETAGDSREALSTETSGPRLTRNPPSVISDQLRVELIRILGAGDDKHAGAFTVAVATRVEKFAVAAREILMTESIAKNDLAALLMTRRHPVGLGSEGLFPMPSSISPLVNNENFGVQAIRQIVDAVQTIGDSPAKLVEALSVARSNNLLDVAAVLEKKLGIVKAGAETLDDAASKEGS